MNNSIKIISRNKKASFQYKLLESFEAGISLKGSEVKAIRENKVNIKESYITIKQNEIYIIGMHIGEYSHSGYESHSPLRNKKLLLHRNEINKIIKQIKDVGKTLIPTKIYFKNYIEDPDVKTFDEKDYYLTSNDNASDDESSPDQSNPRH